MDDHRRPVPGSDPADRPDDPPAPLVVRLDDPTSLVEAVPHLIGFVPDDSFVVVLFASDPFSGRSRSVGTVRMDLLPADLVADAIVSSIVPVLSERPVDGVVLLAWEQHRDAESLDPSSGMAAARGRHGPLLRRALECFEGHGVAVRDALIVAGDRYTSVVCDDPVCCPEQGRRWTSPASSRISLEATIAGFPVPLADREVLRERVEPDDVLVADVGRLVFGATRPAARSLPGPKPFGAVVVAAAVQAFGRTHRCGLDERAEVLGALMLGREREEAVRLLLAAGATPDAPRLPDQQRWWELLCRSAPEELVPAPAALAALAAALCGEGAMANIAVERATRALQGWHEGVETMPEHPQAMLVANTSALVGSGLPPERLRDLLATIYLRSGAEGDLRRDAAG